MDWFGVFIAAVFGLVLGNYTTTVYHRLPLKKPINGISKVYGIKPHCSNCNYELKVYEYYPVLSWISTGFKCNYCGIAIDKMYFALELGGMLISLAYYQYFKLNESYIFSTCLTVSAFLIVVLFIKHRKLYFSLTAAWLLSILIVLILRIIN